METVTFLGKQKSAKKTFIGQHDYCIQKELSILSFGGESSTPLLLYYLPKKPPMICVFGPLLGHLKKNQFCVFMVKIQQPCTIYQVPKQNDG